MRATNRGPALWQTVVGAMGLVVVAWVGGDLYDIVSSGGERPVNGGSGGHVPPVRHGPAGGAPQDDGPGTADPTGGSPDPDPTGDTADPTGGSGGTDHRGGGPSPPAGGTHDPSPYDHG